jgi:hypothetical protein
VQAVAAVAVDPEEGTDWQLEQHLLVGQLLGASSRPSHRHHHHRTHSHPFHHHHPEQQLLCVVAGHCLHRQWFFMALGLTLTAQAEAAMLILLTLL